MEHTNTKTRYQWSIICIHWVFTLLILASLGVGWYLSRLTPGSDRWIGIFNLHVSLGITTAFLALLSLGLRLIHKAPPYSSRFSLTQKVLVSVVNWLLYIAILLLAISGYLRAVYSGQNLAIWSFKLPSWGTPDSILSQIYTEIHVFTAFFLGFLILIHVLIVLIYAQLEPGFLRRMLPGKADRGRTLMPIDASSILSTRMRWLSRSFIFFGWTGFGLQMSIAALSLLILLFASSGSMVSPNTAGIEMGIFWAKCAIVVLVFTSLLSFYFTRIGKKLALAEGKIDLFSLITSMRLLKSGLLLSLIGVLLALIGTGMSITVFISKVVSQPPGIAITDPQRIIRALDVFVLLANVSVIAGHVITVFIWLWLLWRTYVYQTDIKQQNQPKPTALSE